MAVIIRLCSYFLCASRHNFWTEAAIFIDQVLVGKSTFSLWLHFDSYCLKMNLCFIPLNTPRRLKHAVTFLFNPGLKAHLVDVLTYFHPHMKLGRLGFSTLTYYDRPLYCGWLFEEASYFREFLYFLLRLVGRYRIFTDDFFLTD